MIVSYFQAVFFEKLPDKGPFTQCGNSCGNSAAINWIPLMCGKL